MRILLAAGGTAGHVHPALILKDLLTERGHEVCLVGRARDRQLIPALKKHESTSVFLETMGFQRKIGFWFFRFLGLNFLAFIKAVQAVQKFRPDLAVSLGGYAGFIPSLAARLSGVRLALIEQNRFPGISNRILAPFASMVLLNYVDAKKRLPRGIKAGNPVDPAIGKGSRKEALKYFGLKEKKHTLFVSGGSQGASGINRIVLESLKNLKDFNVLWSTGKAQYRSLKKKTARMSHVRIFAFIERMDLAWAAADLAVCRCGAGTMGELKMCRMPALLIPLPHAAENHQVFNAQELTGKKAAEMIEEKNLNKEKWIKTVRKMMRSRARYRAAYGRSSMVSPNEKIVRLLTKNSVKGKNKK